MSDKVFLGQRVSKLDIGEKPSKITRVNLLVDSDHMYTAGDNNGRTIEKTCPWGTQAMCNSILARVSGVEYQPFSGESGLIDPAAETGDGITVGGVYSVLADSTIQFNGLYSADIAAPAGNEVEEEYPYKSRARREQERQLAQSRSSIKKTANEILIEVKSVSDSLVETNAAVASLSVSLEKISSTVRDQSGSIATINQTVSNISLSVTDGSLGSTASIKLSVGDKTKTETIDMTNVRQSFADDQTAITISAGKVSFNTGMFAVNGDTFRIDDDSVSTISGGYETSLKSGSVYFYDIINNDSIGKIGTNYWVENEYYRGMTIDLDRHGSYIALSVYDQNQMVYESKILIPNDSLAYGGDIIYRPGWIYLEDDTYTRFSIGFGSDCQVMNGRIERNDQGLDLISYGTANYSQVRVLTSSPSNPEGKISLTVYENEILCGADLNLDSYDILNQSDERLKKNIKLSDISALSVIKKIKTYGFEWIESGKPESLGFIAQQLSQDVSGDFVNIDEETGLYSIKEMKMIPYLVKAVQELCERLDALEGGPQMAALMNINDHWTPGQYTDEEKLAYASEAKNKRVLKPIKKPEPLKFQA